MLKFNSHKWPFQRTLTSSGIPQNPQPSYVNVHATFSLPRLSEREFLCNESVLSCSSTKCFRASYFIYSLFCMKTNLWMAYTSTIQHLFYYIEEIQLCVLHQWKDNPDSHLVATFMGMCTQGEPAVVADNASEEVEMDAVE